MSNKNKEYTYVVGLDPYKEISYTWWENILIFLRLKKRQYNSSFSITMSSNWFQEKDVIESGSGVKMVVLEAPRLSFWNRVKKVLGFNYSYVTKIGKYE